MCRDGGHVVSDACFNTRTCCRSKQGPVGPGPKTGAGGYGDGGGDHGDCTLEGECAFKNNGYKTETTCAFDGFR